MSVRLRRHAPVWLGLSQAAAFLAAWGFSIPAAMLGMHGIFNGVALCALIASLAFLALVSPAADRWERRCVIRTLNNDKKEAHR